MKFAFYVKFALFIATSFPIMILGFIYALISEAFIAGMQSYEDFLNYIFED